MQETRLLLPFTHGINVHAVERALQLASQENAMIIALSLVTVPQGHSPRGAQLGLYEQSKDFQVFLQQKAARRGVAVQCIEMVTDTVALNSILVAQEYLCEAILLFVQDGKGVLLQNEHIKVLMKETQYKLYMLHLPEHSSTLSTGFTQFRRWLKGHKDTVITLDNYAAETCVERLPQR